MAITYDDGVNRYRTEDGRVFNTEQAAQEHANSLGSSSGGSGGSSGSYGSYWQMKSEEFMGRFYKKDYSGVVAMSEKMENFRDPYYTDAVGLSYFYLGNYDRAVYWLGYYHDNRNNYGSLKYQNLDAVLAVAYMKNRDNNKAVAMCRSAVNYYLNVGESCYFPVFSEIFISPIDTLKSNGVNLDQSLQRDIEKAIKRHKRGSSSTSSTGGGSILFNIIGAIVVAIIGFNILGWLGLIGGAVAGFFLGKWLSGKLIGKILLIVLLVLVGGTFIINKLPSKTAATTENTQTVNGE